jgi:hypothetical protein
MRMNNYYESPYRDGNPIWKKFYGVDQAGKSGNKVSFPFNSPLTPISDNVIIQCK